MEPETLTIPNWRRFQHYKDRAPDWIKLHAMLLDNLQFRALPDASKAHLCAIWLLAARLHGAPDEDPQVPCEPGYISALTGCKITARSLQLLENAGFIVTASGVLAERLQTASPEKRREREEGEKRREREDAREVEIPLALSSNGFKTKWGEWLDYRREKRCPVSARAAKAQLAKLAEHPSTAAAVIDQSIANDWQGLFPEKVRGGKQAEPEIDWSKEQGVRL